MSDKKGEGEGSGVKALEVLHGSQRMVVDASASNSSYVANVGPDYVFAVNEPLFPFAQPAWADSRWDAV